MSTLVETSASLNQHTSALTRPRVTHPPGVPGSRRQGSVLILVVALLVLLAIIGTAFLTTAGNDRDAAVQHRYNTQVDLLVEGMKDLCKAKLVEKVVRQEGFRPANPPVPSTIDITKLPQYFTNLDWAVWDYTLASRYPARDPANPSVVTPIWEWISANPLANPNPNDPSVQAGIPQFSSPYSDTGNGIVGAYSCRKNLVPTSVSITNAAGVSRAYPAFRIVNDPVTPGNNGKLVLAADTDGDGIADSGLFELPTGQIDGVKYYAAVRIIDNCAAINASVAWENSTNPTQWPNITPVNIELKGLLDPNENGVSGTNKFDGPTATLGFNSYRAGDTYNPATNGPSRTPVRDPYASPKTPTTPVPEISGSNPRFQFWTQYDALWTMLGSRLDNPGYNYDDTKKQVANKRYRSLGTGETAALAYRYCLSNTLSPQTVLERYFPLSTRSAIVNRQPFLPSDANNWFQSILDYDAFVAAAKAPPLRPLVVGSNPVSNFTPGFTTAPPAGVSPGSFVARGAWAMNTSYVTGDWVTFTYRPQATSTTSVTRGFVCIEPHTSDATQPPYFSNIARPAATLSNYSPNFRFWAEVPWRYHPVKMNVNTASYGQLFAAFNAIMADAPTVAPTDAKPDPSYPVDPANPATFTFGDPARNAIGKLTPPMMKRLRAALAAVSAIDLRDSDDDVTSRTVNLGGLTAQVFGVERQPYISEVLHEVTKEGQNFVVIELFNPYPVAMDLKPYYFAYRPGPPPASAPGTPASPPILLKPLSGFGPIPPNGYAYFSNRADDPIVDPAKKVTFPSAPNIIPELEELVKGDGNREFLIFRTRSATGGASRSDDPANQFNEGSAGSPNLPDLVPVDQLDFTGVIPGANIVAMPDGSVLMVTDRYHYRRATALTGGGSPTSTDNPWQCVYSDIYRRKQPGGERRERGLIRDKRPEDPRDPLKDGEHLTPAGFGNKLPSLTDPVHNDFSDDAGGMRYQATYRTRTMQVNAPGMPGPGKPMPDPSTSSPAIAPYGGFARAGDILCVTFAGSYSVSGIQEYNSVAADAFFADDGDSDDDLDQASGASLEQLGRFCPMRGQTKSGANIDDSAIAPGQPGSRASWANDLFDYLTVICPQDDHMANVDMQMVPKLGSDTSNLSGDPTLPRDPSRTQANLTPQLNQPKWRLGTDPNTAPLDPDPNFPQDLPNLASVADPSGANGGNEDTAPIHGLINLNTANWMVIASLPFTNNRGTNVAVARAIVTHRDKNGPFRNLFDLQKVTEFQQNSQLGGLTAKPTGPNGDLSPTSGAPGDFESRYLMMNRISNMVTFRSDSFTVYVQVQGWRNVGTKEPELVVQRRAAMLVDRSTVRPIAPGSASVTPASVINVPNN